MGLVLISPAMITATNGRAATICFIVTMLRVEGITIVNITVILFVVISSIILYGLYTAYLGGGREREREKNYYFNRSQRSVSIFKE